MPSVPDDRTAAFAGSSAPDAAGLPLLGGLGALFGRRRTRREKVSASRPTTAPRTVSATERTVLLDPVDAETHEAMDRLSAAVRGHDLGPPGDGLGTGRGEARRDAPRHDDPDVVAEVAPRGGADRSPDDGRPSTTMSGLPDVRPPGRLMSPAELDRAPRSELREQVRLVSAHSAKLQKVVIAQQASLESARDSIAHHRTVARRAKEETRAAIEHKRVAVKLARRERAERMRVTDEHERARAALSNAMALLQATGAVREEDLGTADDGDDDRSAGNGRR